MMTTTFDERLTAAIKSELDVRILPGWDPTLPWAVEQVIVSTTRHRIGQRTAPKGWRVVAYVLVPRHRRAQRGSLYFRRCWVQPLRWDRRCSPPEDAVRLDSIEAGRPSRGVAP